MSLLRQICRAVAGPLLWPILHMPGRSHRGELPALSEEEEAVKANLEKWVRMLAIDIGERNAGSYEALKAAEQLIAVELTNQGWAIKRQPFWFEDAEMFNVEGSIRGVECPDEIVVAGAHYDTVYGSPGADDNATGVAAMLEIARLLKKRVRRRTLRLVGWANEETPGNAPWETMGSYHYARACKYREEDIKGCVSLEMLGVYSDQPGSQVYPFPFNLLYPDTGNFLAFVGNLQSRELVRRCIGNFRKQCRFPSEGVAAPSMFKDINRSDHWSFWQFGWPGLMVTDTSNFRNKFLHLAGDVPQIIDFDRLARVTVGLARMLETLANEP